MIHDPYRRALTIAAFTTLFLLWGVGAMGVIGAEGDRFDMMFLVVIVIGITGAVVAKLRPAGMVRAMGTTAAATLSVGVIAIVLGKHEAAGSSLAEVVGLTGMYAALFAASAWQFQRAPGESG